MILAHFLWLVFVIQMCLNLCLDPPLLVLGFLAHFVFELDSNVSHMGHRILCKSFGIFFGFQIVVKFELAKVPLGFW